MSDNYTGKRSAGNIVQIVLAVLALSLIHI